MFFAGKVWKEGKDWLVEVPSLDIMTQGTSREDALEMIADAIQTLVDKPGFEVSVVTTGPDAFQVSTNNRRALVALFLRRQREKSGLTLKEVILRLKSKSPNAFGRYEQGKAAPTVEKLEDLLHALWPDQDLSFVLGGHPRPAKRRSLKKAPRPKDAAI